MHPRLPCGNKKSMKKYLYLIKTKIVDIGYALMIVINMTIVMEDNCR